MKSIVKNKNGEIIPENKLKDYEIVNELFYQKLTMIDKRIKEKYNLDKE